MPRIALAGIFITLMAGASSAAPEPAATSAPPAAPAVLLLPTKAVLALRQYLGTRPYDEVAGLIANLEACAQVQIPIDDAARSPSPCPEVTAALRARAGAGQGMPDRKPVPEK